MYFVKGMQCKFDNDDRIRADLRGEMAVVTNISEHFFSVKVLTGSLEGRVFEDCPISQLQRDFIAVAINKGRWVF